MSLFYLLENHLSFMALPLLLLAAIAVMFMVECFIKLLYAIFWHDKNTIALLEKQSACLATKEREALLSLYLNERLQRLTSGIRFLHIIAVIAPVIGLLGTILGLIQAFDEVAASNVGVNPALVAKGLGFAMYTTAAGLVIALPCLLVSHLLQFTAERHISRCAYRKNLLNMQSQTGLTLDMMP